MASLWSRVLDALAPPAPLPAKAEMGAGVVALTYDTPISSLSNNPQRKARDAMAAFRTPWVGTAERAVSSVAAAVAWHLENEASETIDAPDSTPSPVEQAAHDFMANPMPASGLSQRQVWALTLRHTGLVGYTFWYLDQRDLLAGTPLSALYIRPDRMLPAEDKAGNLTGWIMDGDRPNGRQPVAFSPDEIVVFRLEPADEGHLGIGLIELAWRKLSMAGVVDRHTEKLIASGGRLAGMISPKLEKGAFSDDEYLQIVRELRNVTDSPDAAKKALIFKVPVDFKQTAASPSQMNLPDLSRMSRDDIFAIWGVALSTVGITSARGLNSGNIPKFEEAATWQNAREPRLEGFAETIERDILARYQALGASIQLELETPTFDDDTPLYEIADKAKVEPLTLDERRALVNKDPLDPQIYGALGAAIYIDHSMVPISAIAPAPVPAKAELEAKAQTTLRQRTEITWEPRIRKSVSAFLAKQREFVVGRAAHLLKVPKDTAWWNAARWDRELRDALLADEEKMASGVRAQVARTLKPPAKADPLQTTLQFVRDRAAERVTRINDTTRQAIADLVEQAVSDGLAPDELASLIADATFFDAARAELISRTETMLAYNDSALRTYADFGVEMVEAIDGDKDEECAARNGSVWPVDEAYAIQDHPNGTLDWIPLSSGKAAVEPAPSASVWAGIAEMAKAASVVAPVEPPIVNVEAPPPLPAPQVIVDTAPFAKAIADLQVALLNRPQPKIVRDANGRIVGLE